MTANRKQALELLVELEGLLNDPGDASFVARLRDERRRLAADLAWDGVFERDATPEEVGAACEAALAILE